MNKGILLGILIFVILNIVLFPIHHNVQCEAGSDCPSQTTSYLITQGIEEMSNATFISIDWAFEVYYAIIAIILGLVYYRRSKKKELKP
ncbi:hypothetical protein KKE06_02950 [Candidatus Micrarchaeota archaeon]|nr:hypothetical protein [Candidatus Micrarchaeota archaeon]MBU1930998.1 hypothetical protein [Candidatus Micrarchaeota archaeon]